MAVGYTTKKLASLDVGDEIEDIVLSYRMYIT